MQCTVLITSFIPTGHIRVFDSIHDDISTDTINQICCIVRSKRSKIKIDIIDVCKQKGTNDCGLYALANATVLCEGELPHAVEGLYPRRYATPSSRMFQELYSMSFPFNS